MTFDPTKYGHVAIKQAIWPVVDRGWPQHRLWPRQYFTFTVRGSSYQIWKPYDVSEQFDMWLTFADPIMTFGPKHYTSVKDSSYQIWSP